MVMQELPQPRPAHVLLRGQYDKPGERVCPGVPASVSTREVSPCRAIGWPWPSGSSIRAIRLRPAWR